MLPTDLPHLKKQIERRRKEHYRTLLVIAHNAQSENAQEVFDQFQVHDENYVHRPYDRGSVELFKNMVNRNRQFMVKKKA